MVPQRRVRLGGRGGLPRPRPLGPGAAAVWVEELARCGSGGLAAGLGAHTGIALPPIARFGTEEQQRALPGQRSARRADRRSGHHRARRGLRRRRDPHPARAASTAAGWSTDPRRSSPAGCAPTSSSPRSRPPGTGGHHGISFLIIERGPGVTLERAAQARLARLRHRGDRLRRRVRARGEPARRRAPGLLPDHGQLPVGAAADGARRRRRHAGLLRADARLRPRPPGPALPAGDPPPDGRRSHSSSRPAATSPTPRCAATWRARTPCAR